MTMVITGALIKKARKDKGMSKFSSLKGFVPKQPSVPSKIKIRAAVLTFWSTSAKNWI